MKLYVHEFGFNIGQSLLVSFTIPDKRLCRSQVENLWWITVHCKKDQPGIIKLFPHRRVWFVTSRLGTGKSLTFFTVYCSYLVYLGSWCGHFWPLESWPKQKRRGRILSSTSMILVSRFKVFLTIINDCFFYIPVCGSVKPSKLWLFISVVDPEFRWA